jgi:hypothetical protein
MLGVPEAAQRFFPRHAKAESRPAYSSLRSDELRLSVFRDRPVAAIVVKKPRGIRRREDEMCFSSMLRLKGAPGTQGAAGPAGPAPDLNGVVIRWSGHGENCLYVEDGTGNVRAGTASPICTDGSRQRFDIKK